MPIEITMPRLSDTMEAGTIIKWNVKEGDNVSAGDVIADVETDKATMEMQVYDDGTISKLSVSEGKSVPVGTVIAVLDGDGNGGAKEKETKGKDQSDGSKETAKSKAKSDRDRDKAPTRDDAEESKREADEGEPKRKAQTTDRKDSKPKSEEDESQDDEERDREQATSADGRVRVSPVARRLADEHGVDLSQIHGSGPSGRIIKRDVMQAAEAAKETAAAVAPSAKAGKE